MTGFGKNSTKKTANATPARIRRIPTTWGAATEASPNAKDSSVVIGEPSKRMEAAVDTLTHFSPL